MSKVTMSEILANLASAKALRESAVKSAKESAAKGEKLIAGQDAAQRHGLTMAGDTVAKLAGLGYEFTAIRAVTSKAGKVSFSATLAIPVSLEQRRVALLASKDKRKVSRYREKFAANCTGLSDAAVLELANAHAAQVEAGKAGKAAPAKSEPAKSEPSIGSPEWIAMAAAALAAQKKAA